MKTNFVLRKYDLSDKQKEMITKKMKRFDKFFPKKQR